MPVLRCMRPIVFGIVFALVGTIPVLALRRAGSEVIGLAAPLVFIVATVALVASEVADAIVCSWRDARLARLSRR